MTRRRKAVVLLSGGLDSTTTLYHALKNGYKCSALIFDYGQRHKRELRSAVAVAKGVSVAYHVIRIKLPWKGSSLLDRKTKIPQNRKLTGIPSTYVPARNMIFLSFALSYAEAIGAKAIFIGANAVDFSGYPDCRPAFYRAFQRAAERGTRAKKIRIVTPLLRLTKKEIVALGRRLGAPLEKTWSCYAGGRQPCGVCDSCRLRARGFML
ncbi:MAG: 7-cyano-7-deazaguanine synthase QueC [Candidatus Margulisbacteria bacterium]|jgi:7-cyano-7-deazaguanine synthase|nr:7-cyano-7-deazaguanine synthase QueC [Candidatus Margulisiibacteriota bacterium]